MKGFLEEEYTFFDTSDGLFRRKGEVVILEGSYPKSERYMREMAVNDFNKYPFVVKNSLFFQGWFPIIGFPLDERYFLNRMAFLEEIKEKHLEDRTIWRETGKPCIAFYLRQ